MTAHPANSVVTAYARRARPDARMHVVPAPFITAPLAHVRTLCGRTILPGTVYDPQAWWTSHHLARTHQTGHCLACLDRDTRPYPEGAAARLP